MKLLGRYPRTKIGIIAVTMFAVVYVAGLIAWQNLPRETLSVGVGTLGGGAQSQAPAIVIVATEVLPAATTDAPASTAGGVSALAPTPFVPPDPITPTSVPEQQAVLPTPATKPQQVVSTPVATAPPPTQAAAATLAPTSTPQPTATRPPLPTATRVPPTPVPTQRPLPTQAPTTRTRGS